MSLVTDSPTDPLLVSVEAAVVAGMTCTYCGLPLSLPIVYHHFKRAGRELWIHPACAIDLSVRVLADVKECEQVMNAHAVLKCGSERHHPEVA